MGAGWVEYALALPEDLDPARTRGMQLIFEAGARTAANRLGWRDFRHRAVGSYPQTEERKLGTHMKVSINGIPLGAVDLPDDPADARGILSLHLSQSFEVASYGFLTTLEADAQTARRILEAGPGLAACFEVPRGLSAGGLNLYGSRMGAYPLDPTVVVEVA
jgi:hypothetical protein